MQKTFHGALERPTTNVVTSVAGPTAGTSKSTTPSRNTAFNKTTFAERILEVSDVDKPQVVKSFVKETTAGFKNAVAQAEKDASRCLTPPEDGTAHETHTSEHESTMRKRSTLNAREQTAFIKSKKAIDKQIGEAVT